MFHRCGPIFFFFLKNRGAAHSKTPHMLSGFPISPGSGSSEAATTKAEVGAVLKSKEMMGTITPVYYTTKKDFKSFVCWMSVFLKRQS